MSFNTDTTYFLILVIEQCMQNTVLQIINLYGDYKLILFIFAKSFINCCMKRKYIKKKSLSRIFDVQQSIFTKYYCKKEIQIEELNVIKEELRLHVHLHTNI